MGYRRWLGFLHVAHPGDLLTPPADRISLERVREYVAMLSADMRPSSVALTIQSLCYAARLIAGERDWRWLFAIKARLFARARPRDRFDRLSAASFASSRPATAPRRSPKDSTNNRSPARAAACGPTPPCAAKPIAERASSIMRCIAACWNGIAVPM
jgi:hypothetical protein